MLIAITPRVRYRAGAPRSAWRATELRQLCANLLNSNLTGSHLPPLVRAATTVPSQAGSSTWNWIIPPSRDSSRGCTRTCSRGHARVRVGARVCAASTVYLRVPDHAKSGKAFVERNKLPARVLKWYFTKGGGGGENIPRRRLAAVYETLLIYVTVSPFRRGGSDVEKNALAIITWRIISVTMLLRIIALDTILNTLRVKILPIWS